MERRVTRRDFLATSAAAGVGMLAAGRVRAAAFKTTLHKAMISPPDEKRLKAYKEVGFEGIECNQWNVPPAKAAAAREMAEKMGMKIHSVLRGWCSFNSAKPDAVEGHIKSVETALRACKAYGGDAVLLVPCRVGGMPMPKPWEFDYAFDPKTALVTRVAKGDNTKYTKYIEAHNHATTSSRAALQKLAPVAEKIGVKIAIENVWNNLWVKPDIFAAFIRSVNHPFVGAYFDIGNHTRYHTPHEWIPVLGDLILKCHVKGYKLNANGQGGAWTKIREGSINWPAVRKALDDIGYNGWLTNESGGLSLKELSHRFDLIIAGK